MTSELRIDFKGASLPNLSCGECGKRDTDTKLRRCTRCMFEAYCGQDCQKKHWPTHKKVCQIKPDAHVGGFSSDNKALMVPEIPTFLQGLSHGIQVPLDYFSIAIKDMADRGGDLYSNLLYQFMVQDSENQAIKFVDGLSEEDQKLLVGQFFLLQSEKKNVIMLNALRITALQKRFSLLQHLFNKIKQFGLKYDQNDNQDRFGWNIAHFIALHSENGSFPFVNIAEIDAILDKRNKAGASPRDFVYWVSTPTSTNIAAFGQELPSLSPEQFKEQMGIDYWARARFTPGSLLRTCFEECPINPPKYLSSFLGPKIAEFIEKIKRGNLNLCLKIRKMQDLNLPIHMQQEWECLTSRDVKKGEVLALYTGTVRHSRWWDESKEVGGKAFTICKDFTIDSDIGGGSLAQFINHGFPNSACISYLYQGLPVLAVIALDDLLANTTLLLSYGNDYFKGTEKNLVNLNSEGIENYLISTNNLKKVPFVEVSDDGLSYYYVKNADIKLKTVNGKLSESETVEAWSNKVRLIYLTKYHLEEIKPKLRKEDVDFLNEHFKA